MKASSLVRNLSAIANLSLVGTAQQCAAVVIGLHELGRGFFPAMVSRGESFCAAFCAEMNANAETSPEAVRDAYKRFRAAIDYANVNFTVQSRKHDGWSIVQREVKETSEKAAKSANARMVPASTVQAAATAATQATQKSADETIATLRAQIEALTAARDALQAVAQALTDQITAIGVVPCAVLPTVAKVSRKSAKSAKVAAVA